MRLNGAGRPPRLSITIPIVAILAFESLSAVVAQKPNGALNSYTDLDCQIRPRPMQYGTPDSQCHEIATQNVTSVSIAELGHGCTITIYSDPWCSFDRTAVREGQCVSLGPGNTIQSFSVDLCSPEEPTISTRIVPLSSSTTSNRPPPSSSTTFSRVTTTSGSTNPTNSPSPTDSNSDPDSDSNNQSTTSSGNLPSSTSEPPPPSSKPTLSTGAIIGLAVGSVIALILINGFLIWYCLRRRHQSDSSTGPPGPPGPPTGFFKFAAWKTKPNLAFNAPAPAVELPGAQPLNRGDEYDNLVRRANAQSDGQVYELSGVASTLGGAGSERPGHISDQYGVYGGSKELDEGIVNVIDLHQVQSQQGVIVDPRYGAYGNEKGPLSPASPLAPVTPPNDVRVRSGRPGSNWI